MDNKDLLKAATNDPEFNAYDEAAIKAELMLTKAFIAKDLFMACVPQLLSSLVVFFIVFAPLSEISKGYLAAIASPAGAASLFRQGKIEDLLRLSGEKKK